MPITFYHFIISLTCKSGLGLGLGLGLLTLIINALSKLDSKHVPFNQAFPKFQRRFRRR